MGCQACQSTKTPEKILINEIQIAIQTGSLTSLTHLLSRLQRQTKEKKSSLINKSLIQVKSYSFNLLSYCILIGSYKSFKYLFKCQGASIPLMHSNFSQYSMNPLHILCERGHLALLEFYLPLYLKNRAISSASSIETINFDKIPELKEPQTTFTAMHVACLFGNLAIVDFLFNYNKVHPDSILNIHEVNEETGENCALIGIRSGSLVMVKGLYEKFNVDFKVYNKFGENAIAVCALCSTKHKENISFEEIFVYLIEEVGIDPCENYEEVLLLLEHKQMVEYFEGVLEKKGIYARKNELESEWRIKHDFKLRERQKSVALSQSIMSSIKHLSDDLSDIEEILAMK